MRTYGGVFGELASTPDLVSTKEHVSCCHTDRLQLWTKFKQIRGVNQNALLSYNKLKYGLCSVRFPICHNPVQLAGERKSVCYSTEKLKSYTTDKRDLAVYFSKRSPENASVSK